jgi:hypothetical protein
MDIDEAVVKIHDLGLSAALISSGIELLGTQRGVMRRVYFVFNNDDKLGRTMHSYWNNTLKVPARLYFDNVKALKSRIYETE